MKKIKKQVFMPVAALMIMILLAVAHCAGSSRLPMVVHVYDGDTIRMDDGRKIRLIGVDAPEVESPYRDEEPFGRQSRQYLKNLLEGKRVLIKEGKEPLDRYGRVLAYVYVDDVLVNGRIIRDGWARAYLMFDYENKDLFVTYEKEARSRGIGIWCADGK